MPQRASRPCHVCQRATPTGYCDQHPKRIHQHYDARRGSSTERGYDSRWQKARRTYLTSHPLCVTCLTQGRTTAATTVDHIVPHKGDQALFWDTNNWQSQCTPCHSSKTAREDGGFGNASVRHAS